MKDVRNACKMYARNAERKARLRRRKHGREDNLKTDLKVVVLYMRLWKMIGSRYRLLVTWN
jgi:hypothetical protein